MSSRPTNIFLVGLMAVGKTTIGKQLAQSLGLPFVDSDQEIERRAGADIAWIFDVEGEAGFRDREAHVIDELTQRDGIVVATGGGAVLREDNRRALRQRGTVVYLKSPIERLVERTARDRKRPLLAGGNPRDVFQRLLDEREPLYREVADVEVVTDRQGPRALVRLIEQKLRDEGVVA